MSIPYAEGIIPLINATNREFLKSLKAPAASFYLCDFHVHSPGSADTRIGDRFDALSSTEKKLLLKLADLPNDLAAYDRQTLKEDCVMEIHVSATTPHPAAPPSPHLMRRRAV
jgi:hypothetical protein